MNFINVPRARFIAAVVITVVVVIIIICFVLGFKSSIQFTQVVTVVDFLT